MLIINILHFIKRLVGWCVGGFKDVGRWIGELMKKFQKQSEKKFSYTMKKKKINIVYRERVIYYTLSPTHAPTRTLNDLATRIVGVGGGDPCSRKNGLIEIWPTDRLTDRIFPSHPAKWPTNQPTSQRIPPCQLLTKSIRMGVDWTMLELMLDCERGCGRIRDAWEELGGFDWVGYKIDKNYETKNDESTY